MRDIFYIYYIYYIYTHTHIYIYKHIYIYVLVLDGCTQTELTHSAVDFEENK